MVSLKGMYPFILNIVYMEFCNGVQVHGKITYNGHSFSEFIPQRTAAYVNQTDTHLPELTVRETFDFAARSQGTGHKAGDNSHASPAALLSTCHDLLPPSLLCGPHPQHQTPNCSHTSTWHSSLTDKFADLTIQSARLYAHPVVLLCTSDLLSKCLVSTAACMTFSARVSL